jgi:hypothetical protein
MELRNTTTRQGNISLSPTFWVIFDFYYFYFIILAFSFSQLNCGGPLIGWGHDPIGTPALIAVLHSTPRLPEKGVAEGTGTSNPWIRARTISATQVPSRDASEGAVVLDRDDQVAPWF